MIWLAALSLAIWLGLTLTGFWRFSERDDKVTVPAPESWPDVVAVVPARNEADVIARSLGSVAGQDYPGNFRVILVDDNSEDGTGDIARGLGAKRPSAGSGRAAVAKETQSPLSLSLSKATHCAVTVLSGAPLASGWTGKLWALNQGIEAARTPRYVWLTDADIEHAPDTLQRLVTIAEGNQRCLVSFMARLHCEHWHEKALIPAFVHYFAMLYPFNWINRPGPMAGAAGGCVLVEREALERAGGIAAIRTALIDDCALGALMKRQGPIWLGLTQRSRSIRPYRSAGEVGAMIARSAYAQLRYSPLILALTVIGLLLMFAVPVWLALAGEGAVRWLALAALASMVLICQPILRFYRLSPLWGLAQPLIGLFYTWCVVRSGWMHWRGKGGMWKGRAQAPKSPGAAVQS